VPRLAPVPRAARRHRPRLRPPLPGPHLHRGARAARCAWACG
jgi:hypothetical protein